MQLDASIIAHSATRKEDSSTGGESLGRILGGSGAYDLTIPHHGGSLATSNPFVFMYCDLYCNLAFSLRLACFYVPLWDIEKTGFCHYAR